MLIKHFEQIQKKSLDLFRNDLLSKCTLVPFQYFFLVSVYILIIQ